MHANQEFIENMLTVSIEKALILLLTKVQFSTEHFMTLHDC